MILNSTPSSSGSNQRLRCSSVPNMASTSMLPVSGAEQLHASGASIGLPPMISARGAYCRLVSPAPYSASGRNRFHSPRPRAADLSSSTTGGVDHGSAAFSACSANTGSAGYTYCCMNSVNSARSRSVVASNSKSITAP